MYFRTEFSFNPPIFSDHNYAYIKSDIVDIKEYTNWDNEFRLLRKFLDLKINVSIYKAKRYVKFMDKIEIFVKHGFLIQDEEKDKLSLKIEKLTFEEYKYILLSDPNLIKQIELNYL